MEQLPKTDASMKLRSDAMIAGSLQPRIYHLMQGTESTNAWDVNERAILDRGESL